MVSNSLVLESVLSLPNRSIVTRRKSQIQINGVQHYLGVFSTETEAAVKYNDTLLSMGKPRSQLNHVESHKIQQRQDCTYESKFLSEEYYLLRLKLGIILSRLNEMSFEFAEIVYPAIIDGDLVNDGKWEAF